MFPQLRGLGYSAKSNFYGLSGLKEASEFISDQTLGSHLLELCQILLSLNERNAENIFGTTDALKLHSSLTLFSLVSDNDIFQKLLDKYFDGKKDDQTLSKLKIADKEEEEREQRRRAYKESVVGELQDLGVQDEDIAKLDDEEIEFERVSGVHPDKLAWALARKFEER